MLVVFMGGFYLAIDTTAGEREHGSLEPLLTQPISRGQLVSGKIAATTTFAALSLTVFLICFSFSLPLVPFDAIGMSLEVGFVKSATIFIICTPLMVFAAALLCVIASFAKSYKEAQTYLTIVIIVPTLPIMMTQFLNLESSYATMLAPSLSQALLVSEVITSGAVNPGHFLVSWITTAVYASLLSALAIHLYTREKILG
jgi:sodium transport system permease protein